MTVFGALTQFAVVDVGSGALPSGFFGKFSQPVKRGLTAAVVATTFAGFVAPPQPAVAGPFTQFSQPQFSRTNLPDEQPSALFEILAPSQPTLAFTQFSQPQFVRINLSDEQPSAFFEILPPPSPPFTGFARFTDFLLAKTTVNLSPQFIQFTFFVPPDSHDGGWIKKRKKRHDPLELKIQEELARRHALELAIYGPEIEYKIETPKFVPVSIPADLGNLPNLIASVQHQNYLAELKKVDDDDENEIEMILKDIL